MLETIRISAAGYPSRSVPRSLGGLSLGAVYVGGLREWCVGGLCGWCVGGPSVGGLCEWCVGGVVHLWVVCVNGVWVVCLWVV